MFQFNPIIRKIVHDSHGFYLTVVAPNNNQLIYQNINESAYRIFKLLAEGKNLSQVVYELESLHKKDSQIQDKVVSFVNKNIEYNILKEVDNFSYAPRIIEVPDFIVPKYCILELSSNCLLNCSHCYLGKKTNNYLDNKKVVEIIGDLAKSGIDYIQLTGGEPLLHPEIERILKVIKENELRLAITTSGYLRTDYSAVFELLKNFKNECFLQVSIDGYEETHNEIRGKVDAFDRSVEFIKNAVSNNIEVQIAYVVQRKNIDDVEKVIRYFKNIGIRRIRFSTLMEAGYGKKEDIIDNQIVDNLVKEFSKKYKTETFDILTSEDSVERILNRKNPNCGCGSEIITIDSELNLLNCVLYRKHGISLKEKTITEVLKLISNTNFNIKAPNEEDCRDCDKIDYCKGCITLGRIEHDKNPCQWGKKWNL